MGARFTSLKELQNALNQKGAKINELNNKYVQFSEQLRSLDAERDQLSLNIQSSEKNLSQETKHKSTWLMLKKRYLEQQLNTLSYAEDLVSDPNKLVWSPIKFKDSKTFDPQSIERHLAIFNLTQNYLKRIERNGTQFDPQELKDEIKNLQKISNENKGLIRSIYITGLKNEIEELQKEINKLQNQISYSQQKDRQAEVDISGCWAIIVGREDYPVLNVVKNGVDSYDGIITHTGKLAHIRRGHRLFSVTRINDRTYDGTEYSFTNDGQPTRIPLRLILNRDLVSINYRSDQVLSLRHCN